MEHQSHRQLLGQQMNAVHILITRLYHVISQWLRHNMTGGANPLQELDWGTIKQSSLAEVDGGKLELKIF